MLVHFNHSARSNFCRPMDCSMPGFAVYHQLPQLTQTQVHWASDAIQPSHPLLFPSPPSLNLSQNQGLFQRVSSLHQVAKVLEFWASASVLPMNIQDWFPLGNWLDFLALQGTFKSLLQHHSSKASIFWCSAFFIVQLLYPYITTEKTIALTRCTFVGKVMSLLFNMLSRLVIAFLPRSKCLLISWPDSPSAVILETKKIKSVTVSIVSAPICHGVMGPDDMILVLVAAAAKSLQSCSTLCDPIDGSPPGPTVPGILQARTLEWVAVFSSNAWKWKVKVLVSSELFLKTSLIHFL